MFAFICGLVTALIIGGLVFSYIYYQTLDEEFAVSAGIVSGLVTGAIVAVLLPMMFNDDSSQTSTSTEIVSPTTNEIKETQEEKTKKTVQEKWDDLKFPEW